MVNGKIYKLVDPNTNETIYIGSTIQTLSMRMVGHRTTYKRYIKNNNKHSKLYDKIKEIGIENIRIVLLEEGEYNSIEHLRAKEDEYICKLNIIQTGYNMKRAKRDQKQWEEDNKDKIKKQKKKYYENNKIKMSQQQKQYWEKNKDKTLQQKKQYYYNNIDNISNRHKQYYYNNKDKISDRHKQKIICSCGCSLTIYSTKKHKHSKKHQVLLFEKLMKELISKFDSN